MSLMVQTTVPAHSANTIAPMTVTATSSQTPSVLMNSGDMQGQGLRREHRLRLGRRAGSNVAQQYIPEPWQNAGPTVDFPLRKASQTSVRGRRVRHGDRHVQPNVPDRACVQVLTSTAKTSSMPALPTTQARWSRPNPSPPREFPVRRQRPGHTQEAVIQGMASAGAALPGTVEPDADPLTRPGRAGRHPLSGRTPWAIEAPDSRCAQLPQGRPGAARPRQCRVANLLRIAAAIPLLIATIPRCCIVTK